jgi:hypothetical protein
MCMNNTLQLFLHLSIAFENETGFERRGVVPILHCIEITQSGTFGVLGGNWWTTDDVLKINIRLTGFHY